MTIRKIATLGHPVLRLRARELTLDELRATDNQRFNDDFIETMRDTHRAGPPTSQVYGSTGVSASGVEKEHWQPP